jgi:hypothetical protein
VKDVIGLEDSFCLVWYGYYNKEDIQNFSQHIWKQTHLKDLYGIFYSETKSDFF